jgi:EAL domain-containing protein (putative c-di-GMP-specific phosphodiesterase class I)
MSYLPESSKTRVDTPFLGCRSSHFSVGFAARAQTQIRCPFIGHLNSYELFLEYQPQFDVKRRAVVGVDALLRWRHPDMGLISPARFIPLVESSGMIESIGAWVIEEACHRLHLWDRAGLSPVRMAVNVSVRQFRDSRLRDQVYAALTRSHLSPERLELEVTESMLMRNTPEAIRMLERLKALRVRLAIDDFGTGFSCLSYLADLPIDTLKIDQSFIRGADGQIRNPSIVRAICTLAAGLGLRAVAEGVESSSQLDFLTALDCDEVQGFLLAGPVAPEQIAEFLRAPASPWPPAAVTSAS